MEPQDLVMCWFRFIRSEGDIHPADEYFYICQSCQKSRLVNSIVHRTTECVNNPFRSHIPIDLERRIRDKDDNCPRMVPLATIQCSNLYCLEDYVLCERCFREYYEVLVDTGEIAASPQGYASITVKEPITCLVKARKGHNTKSARGAKVVLAPFFPEQ